MPAVKVAVLNPAMVVGTTTFVLPATNRGIGVGAGVGRGVHALWPVSPLVYCPTLQLAHVVVRCIVVVWYVSAPHAEHVRSAITESSDIFWPAAHMGCAEHVAPTLYVSAPHVVPDRPESTLAQPTTAASASSASSSSVRRWCDVPLSVPPSLAGDVPPLGGLSVLRPASAAPTESDLIGCSIVRSSRISLQKMTTCARQKLEWLTTSSINFRNFKKIEAGGNE